MEPLKAQFDTNILIDHLSGVLQAKRAIESFPDRAISLITWMEVLVGTPASCEAETRLMLSGFSCLAITLDVAERAIMLRRSNGIKLPDAIILASSELEGRVLATRNTKDFPVGTPGVHVPYQL